MKLIVGLGNPGDKYKNTFHNLGFAVIENLAKKLNPPTSKKNFEAEFYKGVYKNINYILLKPMTFVNLSGRSVSACLNFYKINANQTLLIFDDLDTPLGSIRYRQKGSAGGHNGIKNIIELCHSDAFPRLKMGIGRPSDKIYNQSYVLQKISKKVQDIILAQVEKCADLSLEFIQEKTIQILK